MIKRIASHVWSVLTSFQLTIVSLALLMALVVLCTVAQVEMGTLGAVNAYMRSWFVLRYPQALPFPIPVFPGGTLVGLVLTLNLLAAGVKRLQFSWPKAGLWIIHGGLVLLVAGEFVASMYQVDTRMAIEVGQTVNFVESYRDMELAITDVTDPIYDDVTAVADASLIRAQARNGTITLPGSPVSVKVKRYFPNSSLANRAATDPPPLATMGVGPSVTVTERPPVTSDNEGNIASAVIEPMAGGRSYGTWLVSTVLGAPQSFIHEGRTYTLGLRLRREYLPFAFTLKKFSHDVYPGTQIPKNFSSLVQLVNPFRGESREVLIYMNQPLRYEGKTFYQASFGKNDTLSILSVVENPGWLLPYISCVLVTLGLLVHFAIILRRSIKRRSEKKEG